MITQTTTERTPKESNLASFLSSAKKFGLMQLAPYAIPTAIRRSITSPSIDYDVDSEMATNMGAIGIAMQTLGYTQATLEGHPEYLLLLAIPNAISAGREFLRYVKRRTSRKS